MHCVYYGKLSKAVKLSRTSSTATFIPTTNASLLYPFSPSFHSFSFIYLFSIMFHSIFSSRTHIKNKKQGNIFSLFGCACIHILNAQYEYTRTYCDKKNELFVDKKGGKKYENIMDIFQIIYFHMAIFHIRTALQLEGNFIRWK